MKTKKGVRYSDKFKDEMLRIKPIKDDADQLNTPRILIKPAKKTETMFLFLPIWIFI
jgi:hypothetical protein